MRFQLGDAVRMRPGSDVEPLLGEAAELTGRVGDIWDEGGRERITVDYLPVPVLAFGLLAAEFVRDVPLDAAPF